MICSRYRPFFFLLQAQFVCLSRWIGRPSLLDGSSALSSSHRKTGQNCVMTVPFFTKLIALAPLRSVFLTKLGMRDYQLGRYEKRTDF